MHPGTFCCWPQSYLAQHVSDACASEQFVLTLWESCYNKQAGPAFSLAQALCNGVPQLFIFRDACLVFVLGLFFSMQESILAQVQRVIKGEVSLAMKEQQAAVTSSIVQAMRSAAGTPIPSAHLDFQSQQTHILQLLQQGHLNQAFQQVRRLPGSGHCCLLGDAVGGKRAP